MSLTGLQKWGFLLQARRFCLWEGWATVWSEWTRRRNSLSSQCRTWDRSCLEVWQKDTLGHEIHPGSLKWTEASGFVLHPQLWSVWYEWRELLICVKQTRSEKSVSVQRTPDLLIMVCQAWPRTSLRQVFFNCCFVSVLPINNNKNAFFYILA